MKNIYLALTQTNTFTSKIIRHYTKEFYNHISVSLDESLSEMYSFGRRNPYIAIFGGFVIEGRNKGTFKRFPRTMCKLIRLSVADDSFDTIRSIIERFSEERRSFKYNFWGIFKARKNVNYQKNYRKFYCTQFIKYLLVTSHVLSESFFNEVVKPQDFVAIPGAVEVYEGLLKEYSCIDPTLKELSEVTTDSIPDLEE